MLPVFTTYDVRGTLYLVVDPGAYGIVFLRKPESATNRTTRYDVQ